MKNQNTDTDRSQKSAKVNNKLKTKAFGKKMFEIDFSGGDITSDGGGILLNKIDEKLKLTERLSSIISDRRKVGKYVHSMGSMLRQRIFGIALGYEDLNDHNELRKDPGFQSIIGREEELASAPTLCRMEQNANRSSAIEMHKLLFDFFILSYDSPPDKIVLDFDPTDDEVHGGQEGSHYHGYYKKNCFLPLYVFCDDRPLVSYLRPSNKDGARHTWAILSLLVKNIRKKWPNVAITFRGDSAFCRKKILNWCERNDLKYICGIASNSVIQRFAEPYTSKAKEYFDHTQEKQQVFGEFKYAAKTWNKERRVIVKAEHLKTKANPRFIITNLDGEAEELYKKNYCARGEMENRIKEQKLDLSSGRTSCHSWWPNQFRLLLSTFAYVLLSSIRRIGLKSTDLANARVSTIRIKLLKIGGIVVKTARKIYFSLSSWYPYKRLFLKVFAEIDH